MPRTGYPFVNRVCDHVFNRGNARRIDFPKGGDYRAFSLALRALVLGALLLALAGCGPSESTVHGTATANGKLIEEGFVSFMPLDSQNSTYGASIQDGKYSAKVKPGRYAVVVTGGAKGKAYPKSQADLKTVSDKDLELTDQVPPEAKGNSQSVEIKAGGQELNITLEYPIPRHK